MAEYPKSKSTGGFIVLLCHPVETKQSRQQNFCLSRFQCAAVMPRLDDEAQQARLEAASVRLRKRLVLLHWLTQGCCSVDILNYGYKSGTSSGVRALQV